MTMRAPAFQFYPRQFAGDDVVVAMDLDAIGAHILLMCVAAASPESTEFVPGTRQMAAGTLPAREQFATFSGIQRKRTGSGLKSRTPQRRLEA